MKSLNYSCWLCGFTTPSMKDIIYHLSWGGMSEGYVKEDWCIHGKIIEIEVRDVNEKR